MTQREDLEKLARQMRKDITQVQVNLGELLRAIAALPAGGDDQSSTCPSCGVRARGPLSLAEHLHTSHDGPVPEHWAKAEALAGLEPSS